MEKPAPASLVPAPGSAQPLGRALQGHVAWAGLLQRVRQSQARLAATAGVLPPGLQAEVRAGPLDDSAWVLLVSNASAAAKLRQLVPAMQDTLRREGWPDLPLKVKVQPRA